MSAPNHLILASSNMIMVMIHPNNLSTSFDLLDKRRSHFKIRGIFDFDEKKILSGL